MRHQSAQVVALFVEFLQEHFADVGVDIGGIVEAAHHRHRGLRLSGRLDPGRQAGGGGRDLGHHRLRGLVQVDVADPAVVDLGRAQVRLRIHSRTQPLPGVAHCGHLQGCVDGLGLGLGARLADLHHRGRCLFGG